MKKTQTKRPTFKINGWVNLNKPVGVTSTDCVTRLKRALSPEKIGHAGTLDPLAEGVLPIALGEATKTVAYMMDALKTYTFTVQWGVATETDDREGAVVATSGVRPDETAICAALPKFIGNIWQTPPKYSAIKVDGQRAYDLARAGEVVELKQRLVDIRSLEITSHNGDFTTFCVTSGKGMYVRSLARDLAESLGTVGHVTYLRRDMVGPFALSDTISLDFFTDLGQNPSTEPFLKPVTAALVDIPGLTVTEAEAQRLRSGLALMMVSKPNLDRLHAAMNAVPDFGGELCCTLMDGTAVAIAKVQGVDVRPERVFNL